MSANRTSSDQMGDASPMRERALVHDGLDKNRKQPRREQSLRQMDQIIPWADRAAVMEPFSPKPEGAGRRPIGIERTLPIHFPQHWFNPSGPAAEESLYNSPALRRFTGIDLGREAVSDETTICKCRDRLEANDLGERLFELLGQYLGENRMEVNRGMIGVVNLINAPRSTENDESKRGPEMHQTRKGN